MLQRSLPVEVDEIIRSWYLTIYIINLLIYITNIVFIIIAKKNDINNINNLLLLLLAYLISIINFNVVGPSIIKTFSTVAKVLSIVLIFTCYIVILFSTCYFYDKLTLDIIIVLDIILLIVAYITNKISVKKACEKLFVKFE
ncbi:hypothetical protein [Vallitalea longa]|uniref:hypothetical protein n=1 Tax=Vallitalea longa TaxID=2936439 RepID=UPI0024922ADE|nr:hypothetical protein [Vallitalea longa]